MSKNLRLRVLSFLVIAYMLLAFGWWTVLLFTKNKDAFHAKKELLWLGMYTEGHVKTQDDFFDSKPYQLLAEEYRKQEYMIFGEAAVFVLSLVIGMWLINRSYHEEMMAGQQRRNFLLSITHELKSPIAAISLILETFIKRDLTTAQTKKLSQNGLKDTKRLNSLVNNLLLAAKVESAYQPVLEEIELDQLIETTIAHYSDKYPNAHFLFDAGSQSVKIMGDKLGWASVVTNLIENAIKYSADNTHISVHLSKEFDKLVLQVADQGIGISDKEKPIVFNRFYRVGNEDTRKTKGTGLGLYIVSQIVKAHNGKIKILDNQPKGTVFRIEI